MKNQTLVKEICPTTTQEWVKNGALLVDVREKDEVAQLAYDVPNIINIPLSEFEERYTEVPKDKKIVMVCKGGGRSLRAAGFLINHGYDPEKVVNMKLGMDGWVERGFPTKGDISSYKRQSAGCCGTSSTLKQHSCCDNSFNSDGSKCC
ncbi:rhodanese-related sulfurtransferase [Thermonema lapsum]|uniref:Rhodanese-related sulfurtransferase n=1 Tax=Thermonema lapsum TaxID=28195 RepID=A0A846MPR6_9BACT|nr:rhodanese-like domain-containing protein [Thermonema lapsum]NIK73598.1 rhodanese-related sulfurtransferase [Thermonema lapsum]